jgi:transcriptional regulator with XRE-family HTH domain
MIYFSKNIQLLRKRKKRSQEEIAGALGLKRSTLSSYELGTVEPSLETLTRFSRFFKITMDKLVTLDLGSISEFYLSDLEKGFDTDITGKKLRILATTLDLENNDNVELVPAKAKAGYTAGYADPEFIRVLPTFHLPFLSKSKKYRAFQISGDSMPPVADGSYVTGEYLQNWESVKNGQPYIIVTRDEGVVFKIAYNKIEESQCLTLCSTNPLYSPYDVHITDILEIWKFVNYLSENLEVQEDNDKDLTKALQNLQKDIQHMQQKIENLPNQKIQE